MGISQNPFNANIFFKQKECHLQFAHVTKPIIACYGLQTPENLGSIMRLAANIGCEKIYLIDSSISFRESKIKKTASSAYALVEYESCSTDWFLQNYPKEYRLIAVETESKATNLYDTELCERCIFLLGNESLGLPQSLIAISEVSIYIPMTGPVKSMNVTHALSVVLFEWHRQNYVKLKNL